MKRLALRIVSLTTLFSLTAAVSTAQAGPILDWLRAKHARHTCQGTNCGYAPMPYAVPVGSPYYTPRTAGYAPLYAGYAPTVAGYAPAYTVAAVSPYVTPVSYSYAGAGLAPLAVYAAPLQPSNQNPMFAAQATTMPYNVGYAPYTAGYAPAATAPYAGGVADSNCPTCGNYVRYVPQPQYRTTVQHVPVTVYRPVASIDPATGQPITVMRPCTTSECQVQRVQAYCWQTPQNCANGQCLGGQCVSGQCYAQPYAAPVPSTGSGVITTPLSPGGTIGPINPVPTAPIIPSSPSGGSFPSSRPMPGTSLDPASQQPSLSPGGLQPMIQPVPQASTSLKPWNPISGANSNSQPATTGVEVKVQAVPDPEAPITRPNNAPLLINPRDKVTSTDPLRQYKAAIVNWHEPSVPAKTQAAATGQVERIPSLGEWNDAGWRKSTK